MDNKKTYIAYAAVFVIIASAFTIVTTVLTAKGDNMSVKLKTNYGDIVIELDAKKAPISTENFLEYVKSGFYNGTIFHRVIPGFMIQGGGFTQDMKQKATRANIKNEADNGLRNERGTIAMARTHVPDSASSQFFINLVDNHFRDFKSKTPNGWGYSVFGKVVSGMDVVDKIATVQTGIRNGHQDVPTKNVIIETAVTEE